MSNVAVVIPYYNGSEYIERALSSVFRQTMPPDEVIVVNDGSRDDEASFLSSLEKKYPIQVINKANGGQGDARNTGVFSAKSKYICFLDQDDFFLDDHIEILLSHVPDNDPHFGYCYGDLGEGDIKACLLRSSILNAADHPKTSIEKCLSMDMFVLPSASIVDRKSFIALGGFDKQFRGYEDDDLFLRMFRAGYRAYFVNKPVTVWCMHVNSTSYSILMAQSRWKYFCKLKDAFPDDDFRGIYYIGDMLVPRFGKWFIQDYIRAKASDSKDLQCIENIFDGFVDTLKQARTTKFIRFMKFRFVCFLAKNAPAKLLKYIFLNRDKNFFVSFVLRTLHRIFPMF